MMTSWHFSFNYMATYFVILLLQPRKLKLSTEALSIISCSITDVTHYTGKMDKFRNVTS